MHIVKIVICHIISRQFLIFLFFNFFYLKGEILYNSFVTEEKNVKYTDSYDDIDLSACYVQLLFRCYYSIGLSVDNQGSVLFRGVPFNTVFVALAKRSLL